MRLSHDWRSFPLVAHRRWRFEFNFYAAQGELWQIFHCDHFHRNFPSSRHMINQSPVEGKKTNLQATKLRFFFIVEWNISTFCIKWRKVAFSRKTKRILCCRNNFLFLACLPRSFRVHNREFRCGFSYIVSCGGEKVLRSRSEKIYWRILTQSNPKKARKPKNSNNSLV